MQRGHTLFLRKSPIGLGACLTIVGVLVFGAVAIAIAVNGWPGMRVTMEPEHAAGTPRPVTTSVLSDTSGDVALTAAKPQRVSLSR